MERFLTGERRLLASEEGLRDAAASAELAYAQDLARPVRLRGPAPRGPWMAWSHEKKERTVKFWTSHGMYLFIFIVLSVQLQDTSNSVCLWGAAVPQPPL